MPARARPAGRLLHRTFGGAGPQLRAHHRRHHRQPGFWRDLEIHHPGIDSLRLSPDFAQAWKDRLKQVRAPDGQTRPRAGDRHELVFVRAFYQDIARWAADDPARWGPWAAPCPIKANECTQQKTRLRRKAAMDQRTRTQLPVLPALVRAVEGHRKAAEERLPIARGVPPIPGSPRTVRSSCAAARRVRAGVRHRSGTGKARIHSIEEAAAAGDVTGRLNAATPLQPRTRALVIAADHQRLDVIDQLVAAGTPVDSFDAEWGRQALQVAAQNGANPSTATSTARLTVGRPQDRVFKGLIDELSPNQPRLSTVASATRRA